MPTVILPNGGSRRSRILDQAVIAVIAVCFSPYTGNVTAIPARGLGGNRNNRINRSLRWAVRSERAFEIAHSAECQLALWVATEKNCRDWRRIRRQTFLLVDEEWQNSAVFDARAEMDNNFPARP